MSFGPVTAKICNTRGLHARAASKFVNLVASFDAEVLVSKDEMQVGGTSIMGLMMLGAGKGCSISIEAKGTQSEEAVTALVALIDAGFDETD